MANLAPAVEGGQPQGAAFDSPTAGGDALDCWCALIAIVGTLTVLAGLTAGLLVVTPQSEHVETLVFLLALIVLIPGGAVGYRRLRLNASQLQVAAVALCAAACSLMFGGALLAARMAGTDPAVPLRNRHDTVLLAMIAVAGASCAGWRSARCGAFHRLACGMVVARSSLSAIAGVGVVAGGLFAIAATLPASVRNAPATFEAVILVCVVIAGRAAVGGRRLPRRLGTAVDVSAPLLLGLVICDLFFDADITAQHHENFYLGPVNDVLHGRFLLVDTFSQYGVGVMYFLAAIFRFVPLGYGPFWLVEEALAVAQLGLLYFVLRRACQTQAIAIAGLAVCVLLTYLDQTAPLAWVPSTDALRFGPSLLLVALAVSNRGRRFLPVALALASLWSFETFAYSFAVYFAVILWNWLDVDEPPSLRSGMLWRPVRTGVAACLVAQAVFAVTTRAVAGSWPQWGVYLDYVRLYSQQGLGQLPVLPWSLGLALGGFYVASAIASFGLLRTPPIRQLRPWTGLAVAALTADGALTYTYFLGRSHPNNLNHIAIPAIALLAVWTDLTQDRRVVGSSAIRGAALCAALWLTGLALVDAGPLIRSWWARSALAAAAPLGGYADTKASLRDQVTALWNRPVIDPLAPEGAALVDRYIPGRRALVLTQPELVTEILIRSNRANVLPITNFSQAALSPTVQSRADRAIPGLPCGTRLLYQPSAAQRNVGINFAAPLVGSLLLHITQRFSLVPIVSTASGFVVARLDCRLGS